VLGSITATIGHYLQGCQRFWSSGSLAGSGISAWVLIPSCLVGPQDLSISVVNVNLFSNLQLRR
jgi:hypothetical protein